MPVHFTTVWKVIFDCVARLFLARMLSLHDFQALAFMLYAHLHDYCLTYRPQLVSPCPRIDLITQFTDFECLEFFRFEKDDIPFLAQALGLPAAFRTPTGYVTTRVEALLMLLYRLSYSGTWGRARRHFGRSRSAMSEIVHYVLIFLRERWGHLLLLPPHYREPAVLRRHADAVYAKGCPLSNVAVFIDATIRRVCRPSVGQQAAYSGYRKYHAVKYQNLVAPDGLIVHQFGPVEGRRSDPWIVRASHVINLMVHAFRFPITAATIAQHTPAAPGAPAAHIAEAGGAFIQYCAFGDKGYFTNPTGALIAAYRRPPEGVPLTPAEQAFNTAMAGGRIGAEWLFLKTVQKNAYLDNYKQMKVFGTPVGLYYTAATLLTNVHTCMYGSETSSFFKIQPPTLDEYLVM